jgi:hypothetical protein
MLIIMGLAFGYSMGVQMFIAKGHTCFAGWSAGSTWKNNNIIMIITK